MIFGLPLAPLWAVDAVGPVLMICFAFLSLSYARRLSKKDPENLIWSYLFTLALAVSAFSIGRGVGHIVKITLLSVGKKSLWQELAPVSGALNTITFVIIVAVTFYSNRALKTVSMLRNYSSRVTEAYAKLEKAYGDIQANQEKIIRLERHAIASRMASTLAHETRNPIVSIGGFARRLRKRFARDREGSRQLDIVLEETRRLERLVDGILKAGQEIPTHLQELDPWNVLQAAHRVAVERTGAPNLVLGTRGQSVREKVSADRDCILMALQEIISNAIEASPPEAVLLDVYREGSFAVFTVSDRGGGIEAEVQKRMFEPLFSSKELASGLGLSFAKEIVEANRGRIEYETKAGEGTTFRILLPLAH
jgi:signal transduction histidine kinase